MNKLSTIFTVRHRIQTTWSRSFKSSNRGKKLFPIRGPLLLAASMHKSKESTQNEHITRQKLMTKITEDKEKYLHMTLEEKRKLYKCDDKYKTLDGVLTWEDYYNKNKHFLQRRNVKKNHYGKGFGVKREIRPDLNKKVSLWRGDITTLEIDAIVNAANESLLGGGGVDGAIHRAAGKKLVEECATLRGCKTGEAKITGGYKLPSKYVIHTVGPIGEQKERLKSSYDNCLKLVHENNLVSVAFPCISTGIYGYANEKAAPVAIETVRDWLEDEETSEEVQRVIFCLFLQKDVDIYEELMQHYFPVDIDNDRLEGESRSEDQVTALKDSEENEDNIKNKKIKKEIKSDIKDKTMDESDNKTETTDTKTERNYVNLNSEDTTMETYSEHKSTEENKMEISECHDEKKKVITTKEKIDNTGESDQSDEKKTIILEHKTMNINSGSEEQDKKKNDAPDENKGEMNMEVNESKNVESCVKDMDTSDGNSPERKETTNKPLTRQGLKEAKNNKTI